MHLFKALFFWDGHIEGAGSHFNLIDIGGKCYKLGLSKNASSYDKMHRVLIDSIFEVHNFSILKFEKMSTNS